MATKTIELSPVTRIEGHLAVHTEADETPGGRWQIRQARCEGEMFRGFEQILRGRDPLDAQQIVQRICGVCPISHGLAACRAQEMAYGIKPTHNGRLLQNLILSANYLQSHVLHFYHLSALDFVDVTAIVKYSGRDRTLRAIKAWAEAALARAAKGIDPFPVAPFLPRFEGDYIKDADVNCELLAHYVEALDIRRTAHEMAAVFGARLPHSTSLVPGGCTQVPTEERVLTYTSRLKRIQDFIENVYFPDVVTAAQAYPQYWSAGFGYGDMLAYGVFEMDDAMSRKFFAPGVLIGGKWEALDQKLINEEVGSGRFSSSSKLHPSEGETTPAPHKPGAYTWLKAPRYRGRPMEVGPLARILVQYHSPAGEAVRREVDAVLGSLGVPLAKMTSVLGRILARAIEARIVARQIYSWLGELELGGAPAQDFNIVQEGSGYGLVEAPRGALGHWLSVSDYRIRNYQCIVPTTWNCSPRDDGGTPGPVEKALEGVEVADPEQPIEVGRVIRSFDPCLACAIH